MQDKNSNDLQFFTRSSVSMLLIPPYSGFCRYLYSIFAIPYLGFHICIKPIYSPIYNEPWNENVTEKTPYGF